MEEKLRFTEVPIRGKWKVYDRHLDEFVGDGAFETVQFAVQVTNWLNLAYHNIRYVDASVRNARGNWDDDLKRLKEDGRA